MEDLQQIEITSGDRIDKTICEKLTSRFCKGYILVGEDKTCFPERILEYSEDIKNLEIRDDDIFITSLMKSGTIWCSEMVYMIKTNLDFEQAKKLTHERMPYLELCALVDFNEYTQIKGKIAPDYCKASIDYVKNMPSPRFVKTHVPFSSLPDKLKNFTTRAKIIYIMRNPKDVCVSLYHHGKLLEGWTCTMEELAEIYLSGKFLFGPYWKHIFGYWQIRNQPNVLILRYEEMKTNLRATIIKVAKFLKKDLSEDQIVTLCQHLSLESMKGNKSANFQHVINSKKKINFCSSDDEFIRNGTVGGHKEELSEETITKFDEWILENTAGTSLQGIYS